MAGNNQQITGLSSYVWSPKFGNTTGNKLYDPGVDYSAGNFDRFNDWASKNPKYANDWYSKLNAGTDKFGNRTIASNPNNIANGMINDNYEDMYRAGYESKGKPIPSFDIVGVNENGDGLFSGVGTNSYVDPIAATTTNSSTALTSGASAGTSIPLFLTPTNTSAQWSGTLNGVTGNTSSVPALSTMSLDDQLKQAQIDVNKKYFDELGKPAPTFLGMDRANVGLSMQGLGLASQLYSEFGSDGNRKLRKEQIGALKDDRDRANEEQQAIRDYRNSYKSK